ncbi:hypothetical protein E8E14_000727 [Neopestalotiopsis sp. 37M]|nr:hypothetical protein E8E14_000727 [Neopestalotiopsis sp. 37M]
MTRSSARKAPATSSSSSTEQTLDQYLASQPSIYIVAENLHPHDLLRTKGEEGYRVLSVFSKLDVANEYARKYAYGLKKWDSSPKGTTWAEGVLDVTQAHDSIKQSIDDTDGTHEYVITWAHITTVKVARWQIKDAAPAVNSKTDFFDRVDFVVDAGAADSVYGDSEEEEDDDLDSEGEGDEDNEDEEDEDMQDLKDELKGLNVDRKTPVDSYKDFGVDSRAIMSQLDAQKLLFKKWGIAVGFDDRRLKDDHHENLDDAETRSAVQNILNSICEIAGGPDKLSPDKQYRPGVKSFKNEPIDAQQSLLEKFRGDASHKVKIGWTLRHKARFLALSQHFGNLVSTLYNLVPPGALTSMDLMARQAIHGTVMSADGVSTELIEEKATSSWYIDTQRILMDIEKHIERDMKKDLDAWLCASYTSNNYDNFVQKRLPGTSDWIMNRDVFRDWDSSDSAPSCAKVLWVNGPAGYGKTFLSARVVQHLEGTKEQSALAAFFSADLEDRADPFIVGRHWVSQLISRNPEAFNLAYEKFDLHKTPIASSSEVMDLLKEMVHAIPQCTLVVDGLDEFFSKGHWTATQSDGIEAFIDKIIEAIRGTTSRVFLTSREEQEIRNGLSIIDGSGVGVKLLEYSIIPSDVRPDATKLSESIVSQKLENKSKAFQDEIARRMVDRCDSMLLQIQLLGSEIRATKNQKQTERIIDQTPLGLSNLYDRAWQRIINRGNETPRALAILRWVTFGSRPLSILEMTEALILTDNEIVDNLKDEMPDELNEDYVRREILELCASLIETRASTSSNDWGSRTVHFTHFTVREYVLQHLQRDPINTLRGNNSLALAFDSVQNNRLAGICLRYLIMSGSRTKTQHEDTSHSSRGFGAYANDFMHKHIRRAADNYPAVSGLLVEFFCNEDTQWNIWRRYHDSNLDNFPMLSYAGEASSASPLFYASLFGFQEVVEELIYSRGLDIDYVDESYRTGLLAATHENEHELVEYFLQRNANINKASKNGFTPLYLAATRGFYERTQRFLGSGADLSIATSDGWTALTAACSGGHHKVAMLLLEKGADLNITTKLGFTALALASANGHLETTRLLLKKGADLEIASNHTETPLGFACSRGHLEVAQLLLEEGGDLAVPNKNGWTALAAASAHGHLKTTRLLLERGADLTVASIDGYTPLNLASSRGHPEVVRLLLERGADLTVAAKDGTTPILSASTNGHCEVVRILLDNGADLNSTDHDGWDPLNSASEDGNVDVVRLLLDRGADVNAARHNGWNPLSCASNAGHVDLVKLLLERGADLNAAGSNGWNPLTCASDEGHVNVVKLLLEKGAVLAVASNGGWPPILDAAGKGHLEVVKLLLQEGADINAANDYGATPIARAASSGVLDAVQLLLEKGAEINTANNDGWTPINSASDQGHFDVVKYLFERGADIHTANNDGWTPINSASDGGHFNVVELLLERGADIRTASNDGWTPLHSASSGGYSRIVKLLLEKGADVNAATNNGLTPLYSASIKGHTEVSRQLLEGGADLSMATKHGRTPIFAAAYNGHLDVAELLLREGADVAALIRHGYTPLHDAADGGHPDVVQFLLRNGANMNALDVLGRPPLFHAIKSGDIASFTALQCQEFLQPEFQDFYGSNALSFAVRYGHEEMIGALTAITKRSFTVEDRFGRTPVWWAHKQGNMQMVERVAAPIDPLSPSNLPTGPPARFAADICVIAWPQFIGKRPYSQDDSRWNYLLAQGAVDAK